MMGSNTNRRYIMEESQEHESTLESTKKGKGTHLRTHTIRTKDGGKRTLSYGRKKAIQLLCTECLGWETNPKDCTSPLCPVFPFRGKTLAGLKGEDVRDD
jgi:hypothetical protein